MIRDIEETDKRTLAEIYGLDAHDPWEQRTPEQITKDEEVERRAKEAIKGGKMSADSYAGTQQAGAINVNGITATTNADGEIIIHDVRAFKTSATVTPAADGDGRYVFDIDTLPEAVVPMLMALQIAPDAPVRAATAPALGSRLVVRGLLAASRVHAYLGFHGTGFTACLPSDDGEPVPFKPDLDLASSVSESRTIGIYHRLDVAGMSLPALLDLLESHGAPFGQIDARGQAADGAWIVAHPERVAQGMARTIQDTQPDAAVEVYAVDRQGGRLAPRGVVVVSEPEARVIGPRPWNRVEPLWQTLDEAAQAAARGDMRWDEFVFTGRYVDFRTGTLVFISPYSFIEEHDETYDEVIDFLDKALPPDFERLRPGVYRTHNRDYLAVNQMLCGMGMSESLELQLILNRQRHLYFA